MISNAKTSGRLFRDAVAANKPLQIVGAVNAYCAMLAKEAGHKAIYLSGAGVANASYGLPDLGMTSLDDVLVDVRRIVAACDLPLLVDIDTGWGGALNIARTVREMERAGVGAVHMEDQISAKRCGHRPGKEVVATGEMCDRIKSAVDGRRDPAFVIMARTDAVASEGVEKGIERSLAYMEAGADMIFAEALRTLEDFKLFCSRVRVPVLANITEFGKTPLLTREELGSAGISMILYPLSAFRAMSKAALVVYSAIANDGTQKNAVPSMQTREELYGVLGYHAYEEQINKIAGNSKE